MKKDKKTIKEGKNVIKAEINALKKLYNKLGTSFFKAIELIYNTKGNLVFTGVGKSKLILEKTCGTFSSLGMTAYTLDPTAANHGDMGRLQQKDLLIIASNSGNSNELDPIFKFAKIHNIKILGITSNNKSQLFKNSFIKLLQPKVNEAGSKTYSLVPTSSTTVLAALGDALAITVANKKKFKISSLGRFHPSGSIGKSLTKIEEFLIPKSQLPYVKESDKFSKILIKISSAKLGCVLINNLKDKKINIITDGDTARAAKKFKNFNDVLAKNIMTKNPIYIESDVLINDAIKIFNKKRIGALLVKKKGKFIGMVTLHTLLDFLNK